MNLILTGFSGKLTDPNEVISYSTANEIANYQSFYDVEDLDNIRGQNFMVLLIDVKAFEQIDTVEFNGIIVPKDSVISNIKNKNALNSIIGYVMDYSDLPDTESVRSFVTETVANDLNVKTEADAAAPRGHAGAGRADRGLQRGAPFPGRAAAA